ncbi:MAG: hypothetical protein ABIV50_03460, partial [Opitutus sp.]
MLRWSLLSLASVFFAMGLLTAFRSPDWNVWQLALLAGEFGHWFSLVALGTVVAAWLTRASGASVTPITMLLGSAATILLLKPT